MTFHIGMLLYPSLTQLDLTGPFEVLHRLPGAKVDLVWKNLDPVRADSGLRILPSATFADTPHVDLLFVPGGGGQMALLDDPEVLDFLQDRGQKARFVSSVCTGALLLGAVGLLDGYSATTHWAFADLLPVVGARPARKRVVVDRNRITGGGVTAGIDFALRVVQAIAGREVAERIQLDTEYDPRPLFKSGNPEQAHPALVAQARQDLEPTLAARRIALERVFALRSRAPAR